METADRLLSTLARVQHGAFTRRQAIESGVSDRAVDGRVKRGMYAHLYPSVFAFAGSPASWRQDVVAAVLSIGDVAAASHNTAAYLWDMTSSRPAEIEVITHRHDRVHRDGFVVHESKDLTTGDMTIIDGIPVTIPARTLVDLGASAPLGMVGRCLDTALREAKLTLHEVQRLIKRVARPGRTGIRVIRLLVEERMALTDLTESALEDLFRSVVLRSGLPVPGAQFEVCDPDGTFVGRFDFAYPRNRALIELDSEKWHMDPDAFQRDREKQNRAHALGWTVYRFTWRQLTTTPQAVISTLAYISAP